MVSVRERQATAEQMERRASAVGVPRPSKRDTLAHLSLVIAEICDLMHGDGVMLSLFPGSGDGLATLFVDKRLSDAAKAGMLQSLGQHVRPEFEDGQCFWRDLDSGGFMLAMPVEQLAGHGRLVISVFFAQIDADGRRDAERLYRERRPFAVGFFHLWQQNRMLQQRAQSLESVLDQTAIGLVMINRAAQIVFANQTADEILAASDGVGRSNGMLRATNLADGVNLQAAISHAMTSEQSASQSVVKAPLIAFHRRKGAPLVAAFLPVLTPPVEQGDVAAIMYLVDPQIDTGKMLSPLCRLHGLSPVETTLVCHLAAGETITSAAHQMHVKEQTARSYLKTIFIKTGTKRQTELVVLMLSSLVRTKQEVLQEALTSSGSERALGMHARHTA